MKKNHTHKSKPGSPALRLLGKTSAALSLALLVDAGALQAAQGPQPSICNRSCWGARASSGCSTMSSLNRAIVHHTAGPGDYTADFATGKTKVRGVQNLHMDSNGWCDIAYHFLVDAGGHVYEGRSGSMSGLPRGAHDSCNDNSFGFNVMGYYHPPYNQTFTTASRSGLEAVIAWRMPSSWSPYGSGAYCGNTVGTLDGHYKVKSTACPGDGIIPSLAGIRDGVNTRKNGGTPPPPEPLKRRIDVFVRATDNSIRQRYFNNNVWNPSFVVLSPANMATSDPTAASWDPGRIDIFVRSSSGTLKHKYNVSGMGWFPNGQAGDWEDLGGSIAGSPDACSWGAGRLDIFARNSSGNLVHKWYDGNWSAWENLGGTMAADPSAVSWGNGRIDIFSRDANANLIHKYYVSGNGWSVWESLGGPIQGSPDACAWGPNHIDVLCWGTNNSLQHKAWNGSSWTAFSTIGTAVLTASPGATSYGPFRVDTFMRGSNGGLYQWFWDGTWHNGVDLGGTLVGGPDACSWTE